MDQGVARSDASAPVRAGGAWAPRVARMYLFTALMFLAPGLANLVLMALRRPGLPDPPLMWGVVLLGWGLLVVFGVLAHRDYRVARQAIQLDPSLRGRWLVENAWWLGYVALVLPVLLWLALGFAGVYRMF